MEKSVNQYNNRSPYNNIAKLRPVDCENKWLINQLKPKPIFTIFDNEKLIRTDKHQSGKYKTF